MADGYWNRPQQRPTPLAGSAGVFKRPRYDFDLSQSGMPSGREMRGYLPSDDDRGASRAVKDTKSIDSAYDLYLQHAKLPSSISGEANLFGGVGPGRPAGVRMPGSLPMADPIMGNQGSVGPDLAPNGQHIGFGGQTPMESQHRLSRDGVLPLPPDASNTLFVEGLPSDCTRREVAHIFRPFVGYREVRLVTKEAKHRGGDPIILCFVDFENPACAATAMSALQGYEVDENDPDSKCLRLQFSRNPGRRFASGGPRGRR